MLGAALAVIAGHNWMVWLKFNGGKGAGATIGAVSVLLPVYGYWPGLMILFVIIAIPLFITRNVSLAIGIGVVALIFIAWLGMGSGWLVMWSMAPGLLMAIRFYPTARRAWAKTGSAHGFIFDQWRREKR